MSNTGLLVVRRNLTILLGVLAVAIAGGFGSCNNNVILPTLGPVQLNPTSVSFSCPDSPKPFVATQTNFVGTFQAMSNNNGDATVAATSPPGTFVVTPVYQSAPSSTTITVTGGGGITANENVSVVANCVCVRHRDMWLEK